MAIKNFENGRVEIGGRVVRKRNPDELKTLGARPEFPSLFESTLARSGFDPKADIPVRGLVTRDDDFLRRAMIDFEAAVATAFENAMAPAIAKVKNVLADGRFTPEAQRQQAEEVIAPARAKWLDVASKQMLTLQNGLRDIEILIGLALLPEAEDMKPEVAEVRARECREVVLSMEPGACAKLLLELGSKAALEPLHALKSDPLKRDAAPAEVLAGARAAAIKAQDGAWLLQDWEIQKKLVSEAAARLSTLEAGVNVGLQALGLESRSNGGQWAQLANNALAKSEAVLV